MKKLILGLLFVGHFCLAAARPAPILVQGAMDIEVDQLVAALENKKEVTLGSWTFWQGEIDHYPVVVSRTDVGLTNAAAATTLAVMKFSPRLIINQGTAGGHDPAIRRGDIVIGQKIINPGSYRSTLTASGEGVHPHNWLPLNDSLYTREKGKVVEREAFYPDKALINLALAQGGAYPDGNVVAGTIASANAWNRELDHIAWLHKHYGTTAEEMEAVSVAHVASAFHIPFLAIRVISNTDVHGQDFDPATARRGQAFTLTVIHHLTKQPQG